ncbi:hypothetical protein E2C01_041475 [Portunus trituberculatus]|uniref:Uncharacterized protein n=1 Tax=Portunus trituberculatus TaxID=210409 RepID=A0A5B7FJC6_PORTR|nr:hypothetical protein [Portunus trituberculatus]
MMVLAVVVMPVMVVMVVMVVVVMVMVMALAAVRNMHAQHVTNITITNHSCSLHQSSFPAPDTMAPSVHHYVSPSVHGHSFTFCIL